MKRSLFSLLMLQFAAALCYSQTEADPYKNKNAGSPGAEPAAAVGVSFEEEILSLSLEEAHKLMRESGSDPERYHKAMALLQEGKAKLERFVVVRGKLGERSITESIVEFRYPTEFRELQPETEKEKPNTRGLPVIVPEAFETRNLGDTIEWLIQAGADPKSIDLDIIPSRTVWVTDRKYFENVEQPIFRTQKMQTKVSLQVGQPYLLGTLNPPVEDGFANAKEQRVWFDFVTILYVKPEAGSSTTTAAQAKVEASGPTDSFVIVGGEVKSPQRLSLTPKLTLLGAIEAAGGFTDYAARKKVVWISEGKKAVVDATIILSDPAQDIVLKDGDQVHVPPSTF